MTPDNIRSILPIAALGLVAYMAVDGAIRSFGERELPMSLQSCEFTSDHCQYVAFKVAPRDPWIFVHKGNCTNHFDVKQLLKNTNIDTKL